MEWNSVYFSYDGSFQGFLSCVFESYYYKERPLGFFQEQDTLCLFECRNIITDQEQSQRVYKSLSKYTADFTRIVQKAFLTPLEDKEMRIYALIAKYYADGPSFLNDCSDSVYHPVFCALRDLSREVEKYKGFVRFSDYHGTLYAEIEPKNQVLPVLRHHFCNRYANESFAIYDKKHKEILLYSNSRSKIIPIDHVEIDAPDKEELQYRTLWRQFFRSVTIDERYNPRCQNTNLPKKYRPMMTEFTQDSDINRKELPKIWTPNEKRYMIEE